MRGTSVVGNWGAANSAVKVASRTEVSCRTLRVPVRGTSVEDRRGQRPEWHVGVRHVGVRHVGVRHGSANGMGLSESFLRRVLAVSRIELREGTYRLLVI